MSNILITLMMILLFFFQGKFLEVIKKITSLVTDLIFKFLNFLGIKIDNSSPKIKTSKQFKQNFEEIIVVRESRENMKTKSSISWISLIVLILSLSLLLIDLKYMAITNYLCSISWVVEFVGSEQNVNTTVIATTFSLISLSLSKLLSQWKETKKYRIAKKEIRDKQRISNLLSSKDLLTIAKAKDKEIFENTVKNKEEIKDKDM